MKIRTDFVTNSSSSGFAVIKIESRTLNELLKKKGLNYNIFKDLEKQCEGESWYISAINDSVANTLASLLIHYYVYVPAYDDIMDEIFDNSPESDEEIRSAVDNALKQINDIDKRKIDEEELEDAKKYKNILELIQLILDSKNDIDADATCCISCGEASSDTGCPDFSYSELKLKKGNGTYTWYSVSDEFYCDDNNPSAFYKWAKKYGYYHSSDKANRYRNNDGYDEDLYHNPPYKLIAKTYDNVNKIQISNGIEMPLVGGDRCRGLNFVITGKVHIFANREEFNEYVEKQGGHVSKGVSHNTDYLVNNDIESQSSKNRKAKELGITIITEDMFVEKFGH